MILRVGLRTQLLLGLVVLILVATASVGAITVWAARRQIVAAQVTDGRVLGRTLARVVAPSLAGGAFGARELERTLQSAVTGGPIASLVITDAQGRPVAGVPAGGERRLSHRDLQQSLSTGEQAVGMAGSGAGRLAVSTPIHWEGRLLGAVRLELPLGVSGPGWPLLWILLGVDGAVIVLFVGFVLTRYVIRPVESMQRAASRVREGDLTVRLPSRGAPELASLAASFNAMTASVQEQLGRLERQQRQLEASREQIIRSEKLASVGRLAAGVAHEVGNPLQSIIGFTGVLLQGGLDPAAEEDFLRRVEGETQRIHRIVRELLDYARPVEDAVESVSLVSVVEQALQLVGPQERLRRVEVTRSGLESLPPVAANTQRLVQVLVNLLLNAADAIGGEGQVWIDGQRVGAGDEGPGQVELSVANSGPPIPFAERGRIFDPFFSTKEPGEGTGLGLSVTQSIVESYGGRITLADTERTTFVLALHEWVDDGATAASPDEDQG